MTRMRIIGAAAALGLLALTGCATTTTTDPTVNAAPDSECLTVSPEAQAALEAGIVGGYTITAITAVHKDEAWWVSAHLTGDPDVTATWMTIHDPTTAADNAYTSATKLASLTSTYLMPEDLTGADIITQSQNCLP